MKLRQLICCATILLFLGCAGIQKDTAREPDVQSKAPNTANRVRTDVGWQFRGFAINETCKRVEVKIHEIGDANMSLLIWSRMLLPGPNSGYYEELEMPYTKEGQPKTRLHEKMVEEFHQKHLKQGMPWKATIWLYGDKKFKEAADAFRLANHLRRSWKLLYNIGQCEAAAKRYGMALDAFERYVAEGGFSLKAELGKEAFGDGHGH